MDSAIAIYDNSANDACVYQTENGKNAIELSSTFFLRKFDLLIL
jgi:hypothetical protein